MLILNEILRYFMYVWTDERDWIHRISDGLDFEYTDGHMDGNEFIAPCEHGSKKKWLFWPTEPRIQLKKYIMKWSIHRQTD